MRKKYKTVAVLCMAALLLGGCGGRDTAVPAN